MSPYLLVWVAAFIMQCALLGRTMFAVGLGRAPCAVQTSCARA